MKRWLLLLLIAFCTVGCRAPMPGQQVSAWSGPRGTGLYHIFNASGAPASAAATFNFNGFGPYAVQCCTGTSLGGTGTFNLAGGSSSIAILLHDPNITLAAALAENSEAIEDFVAAISSDDSAKAMLVSVLHEIVSIIDSPPSARSIPTGALHMTALPSDTQISITLTDAASFIGPDLFSGDKAAAGPADTASRGSIHAVAVAEPSSMSLLLGMLAAFAVAVGGKAGLNSRKIKSVGLNLR
jgi:hypothetical protein